MNEGDGLAAMAPRLGVDGSREQNAVARREAFLDRSVAGKACGELLQSCDATGTGDHFGGRHGDAGTVAEGFDSEIVVGFLREARFAPRAFESRLRNGDAGRQPGIGRALLRRRDGSSDELLFSHKNPR